MIPRVIHQIWIGPNPRPQRWLDTWRTAHPNWEYLLWDEYDIDGLIFRHPGARNARAYREYLAAGVYDAAADIARAEILSRYGGIAIDADSICHRKLDGAVFLEAGFFATREIPPDGAYFITPAFMGSEAGHPLIERYCNSQPDAQVVCEHGRTGAEHCCAWRLTGPQLLTRCLADGAGNFIVLEPWVFFRQTIKGAQVSNAEYAYGEHMWSSTGARSNNSFPAATPYEVGL